MRCLVLITILVLAGCFEEGSIELGEDRINVRIGEDSQGVLAMVAEAFLRAERAADNYLIEGQGRDVYFERTGVVPSSCSPDLNCYTFRDETLHALAIDRLEVRVGHGLDLDGCYPPGSYPEIASNLRSESRWIASDLRRLGFEEVVVRHDAYCAPSIPQISDVDSTSRENVGLFVTSFVLNNEGFEPIRFNETDQYRTTDGSSPPCFSDDCRAGIEFGREQIRDEVIPAIPQNVGRFKFQALNRIVIFHAYGIRSECPTVDPINWAFSMECY